MAEEQKDTTPATTGSDEAKEKVGSARQAEDKSNPSAPGNTGTTPGTNAPLG